MQILEGRGESLEITCFKECFHPELNPCSLFKRLRACNRFGNFIFKAILGNKLFNCSGRNVIDSFNQVSYPVSVNRIPHFDLCAYLISFSYCPVAHIVSKTCKLHIAAIIQGGSGPYPDSDAVDSLSILIMTDNNLPVKPEPCTYKPEFAVAMR